MKQQDRFVPATSITLAILVLLTNLPGLLIPGFYSRETPNWQAQAVGQDIVDVFLIVPSLLITSFFAYKKSITGLLLWGGVLCYLVYTFIIYCFAVHFNRLFVVYCFTLGLSFYSFVHFIMQWKWKILKLKSHLLRKIIGVYFLVASIMFSLLWLAEIIPPAIENTIPVSLTETGLFTNPVHVLDLSIFLPALFITAVLLFKQKPLALILAPVFLFFTILMNISIATLQFIMVQTGVASTLSVLYLMITLAIFSLVLLVAYFKSIS